MLKVALGIYDLTIVGNHQVRFNHMEGMGLSRKLVLSEPLAHRWVIRAKNDQLRNALNSFIESEYRGTKYNLLHAKYFHFE